MNFPVCRNTIYEAGGRRRVLFDGAQSHGGCSRFLRRLDRRDPERRRTKHADAHSACYFVIRQTDTEEFPRSPSGVGGGA